MPVFGPPGSRRFLERAGFRSVRELEPGESAGAGDLRITAVESRHAHGRGLLDRSSQTVGFEIAADRRVYFAGDTDLFEGMRDLAGDGLDLALLPVWGWGPTLGPGHLDPERAARAAAMLSPRVAIPIHWGTFFPLGLARLRPRHLDSPPRQFARFAARIAPQVEVRTLSPGESTALSA